MNVLALPAFSDNVIWVLHDGLRAAVVDPGDEAPVLAALDAHGLQLEAILVTHHHPDHVAGIDGLRHRLQGPVYGPRHERIPAPFVPVDDGDTVDCIGLRLSVMHVPGHTAGHLAYVARAACPDQPLAPGEAPALFSGDTLFSGGCGRLFEGSPGQMLSSLKRLAALPPQTLVYCAHEYTVSNLRFAQAVEPENPHVAAALARCTELREAGRLTLPSKLSEERLFNPFLRCTEPSVVAAALARGAANPTEEAVFAGLREWKNRFR